MATFVIRSLDGGPTDFEGQLPVRADIFRQIAGPDRDDLCAFGRNSVARTHADAAHHIALVIDNTLGRDERLDFPKVEFAAVGFADAVPGSNAEEFGRRRNAADQAGLGFGRQHDRPTRCRSIRGRTGPATRTRGSQGVHVR